MSRTDVEVAVLAARAGAEVVRAHYGRTGTRHGKGGLDFATDADLAAERAICEVLREHRPGDGIRGEEYGADDPSADRTWLVDPICGTLNFAARTPLVAVNVALREGEALVAAAVADPVAGELFWADAAGAAHETGGEVTRVRPSAQNRLVDLDLGRGATRSLALAGSPGFHDRFTARVLSTTLSLPWVAAGRLAAVVAEGDVDDNLHYAAGLAVCGAAGCRVTDLEGGPVSSGGGLLVAADDDTHRELLDLLTGG